MSSLECHCEPFDKLMAVSKVERRSKAISYYWELTWHNPRDCHGLRPRNDEGLCVIAGLPRHYTTFHTQVSVWQNSGYLPPTGRPAVRRARVNMEAVSS